MTSERPSPFSGNPPPEARLDEYLDGLLNPAERAEFETFLAIRPDLAAVVQLQQSVDRSLERLFTAPAADLSASGSASSGTDGVLATIGPDAPPGVSARPGPAKRRKSSNWWPISLAASLAIAATVFFLSRSPGEDSEVISPSTLYSRLETTGFSPAFECTTEKAFADLVSNRLGAALFVPATTAGVLVLGWAYGDNYNGSPLGPNTLILLAKVDQNNVMVLMDREKFDRRLTLPARSNLQLFRREMNGVVMYEITPLSSPRILDAMTLRTE